MMLFLSDTSALARRKNAFSLKPQGFFFFFFGLLFSFPSFNRDEANFKGKSPIHERPFLSQKPCARRRSFVVICTEYMEILFGNISQAAALQVLRVQALCSSSAHIHLHDTAEQGSRQAGFLLSCWRMQTLPFRTKHTAPSQGINMH